MRISDWSSDVCSSDLLRHQDIWRAIDRLARESGMSPSGLARRAGLDPTTFNKSKRIARDGKPRWPTTESISKITAATRTKMGHFVARSAELRVGKEGVSTCRYRGGPEY